MFKKILLLLISTVIAVFAVFVQQFSSSDRPYYEEIKINNIDYSFKLPVYHEGNEECLIELSVPDTTIKGLLYYKLFKSNHEYNFINLIRMNENLVSVLPHQKQNIKVQYYLELNSDGKKYFIARDNPVIVRFQGVVPKYVLFPQVAIMFVALIFSCFAGMLTFSHIDSYKKYAKVSFYLFTLSALVIGIIIHLISFRHLFVQVANNNDLTFYKNGIIFLLWLAVYYVNRKSDFKFLTLAVSILTLILYCVSPNVLFDWIGK
jgi:hypothetical protein